MTPPTSTRHKSPTVHERAASGVLKDNMPTSDNEGGERPVREQLKKTSIAGSVEIPDHDIGDAPGVEQEALRPDDDVESRGNDGRGRLRRKRSIEDVEGGHADDTPSDPCGNHVRKRSRDNILQPNGVNAGGRDASRESPSRRLEENVRNTVTIPADHREPTGADDVEAHASSTREDASQETLRESVISPKNKRSRDQFLQDQREYAPSLLKDVSDTPAASSATAEKGASHAAQTAIGEEPEAKRHRESASPESHAEATVGTSTSKVTTSQVAAPSGFSNTSVVSPFGALQGSKPSSNQPQTTASAFASSGFAALAGSSASPFGALGTSKPAAGPFGALSSATQTQSSAFGTAGQTSSAPGSAFGATLGNGSKSAFASVGSAPLASGTSGFGSLGGSGGFGSGFGGLPGGGLKSFAGTGGSGEIVGLSDKPAKPFGAAAGEEEEAASEEDEDGNGVKSPAPEEKKDRRFFEQDVETGEEHESTIFTSRAKLYNFVKDDKSGRKEWKERGLGTLKLNVVKPTPEEHESSAPKRARFIMRAEGSHRVVLNSPVQKELKVGDAQGGRPAGGYVYFWGSVDGKPTLELLQLKMRQQFAEELYRKVSDLQREM